MGWDGRTPLMRSFPEEFARSGVKPRKTDRDWFLGTTVSHPTPNEYLIGFAYDDLQADQTDEDLYRADLTARDLRYFPRGSTNG